MPAYKVKRFPAPFDAPRLAGLTQTCAFILAANWCLQGMRGMDRKELSFRLLLELGVALLLLPLAALALPHHGAAPVVLAAWTAAHTLGFTLNGQVWVCARYCRLYGRRPSAIGSFAARAWALLRRQAWLDEAVLIGSRAGDQPIGRRSDIDLRLVVPPGPVGWLRANLLLLRLRAAAFLHAIPLDLYAYDAPSSLRRHDQGEPLRVILDRRGRIEAAFGHRIAR